MTRSEIGHWAVRGFGLGIGFLFVAILAIVAQAAADVLVLVLIAVLLASALDPAVDWVRGRIGISRVKAITAIYLLMLVIAGALLLLVVPAALSQLTTMSDRAPTMIDDARAWVQTVDPPVIGTAAERLISAIESGLGGRGMPEPDAEDIVEAGLTAADAAISVITVLTLVFFWLISREPLQRFSLAMLPADQRGAVRETWNRIEGRMGDWVRGQLILMTTIGMVTTVAYLILGLENAILLGLIAGLAEIIPIVGPAIGAIPALISAFLTGGPELALAVAAIYVVIQVVEGQLLVPVVMRRSVGLPPFIVIVSLLIGGALAGLVGALLAVPMAAAIVIVLENVQARKHAVRMNPPDPDEDASAGSDRTDEDAATVERPGTADSSP